MFPTSKFYYVLDNAFCPRLLSPPLSVEDEEPRKKAISYEVLRYKNRENFEVTLNHKSETLLKPSPDREPGRPRKDGKLLLQRCLKTLAGLGKD